MNNYNKPNDFKFYAATRIAGGIIALLFIFWVLSLFFGSSDHKTADHAPKDNTHTAVIEHGDATDHGSTKNDSHSSTNTHTAKETEHDNTHAQKEETHKATEHIAADKSHAIKEDTHGQPVKQDSHGDKNNSHDSDSHGSEGHGSSESMYKESAQPHPEITGWSFVEATMIPLNYELKERFLGWRPNDIILGKFTDNVNNFQRGVLEVTRRTAVKLAEDISRTGSTASFNPHLESAMNWFMIKPDKFWFPSAEGKYKSGLSELKDYQTQLLNGEARFYNRSDNLIPLLKAYRNLLGSCDDNLVKMYQDDGSKVSFFKSDDYFYYAKGVAKSMAHILKSIEHDFNPVLKSRNGLGSLEHAIHSLEHADHIEPWLILNHNLSGVLANHRANLATAISHGRFYLGVLITTLST